MKKKIQKIIALTVVSTFLLNSIAFALAKQPASHAYSFRDKTQAQILGACLGIGWHLIVERKDLDEQPILRNKLRNNPDIRRMADKLLQNTGIVRDKKGEILYTCTEVSESDADFVIQICDRKKVDDKTFEDFGRLGARIVKRKNTGERDLKYKSASDADLLIRGLIASGKIVELSYDGEKLNAYRVISVDGYNPGVTDPKKYRGVNYDVRQIFNSEEAEEFVNYLKAHKVKDKFVRFKVVLGDISYENIAHAGLRDNAVYIGKDLLKRMFQKDSSVLRDEVLAKDELRHMAGLDHGSEEEREARLELVKAVSDNLRLRNETAEIALPEIEDLSLKSFIEKAPDLEEYCVLNGKAYSKFTQAGKTYYYFKGVCELVRDGEPDTYRILANQKIFSPNGKLKGTIFAYYHINKNEQIPEKQDNSITFVIRSSKRAEPIIPGGDRLRGEESWDEAVIKVYLDGNHDRITMIDYVTKPLSMSLSRTSLGILFHDAGFEGELEELCRLFASYFVMPEVNEKIRIREEKDNVPVPLETVKKVKRNPQKASDKDIETLEAFEFYKSWSVRQVALDALEHVSASGRITLSRLARAQAKFDTLSIEEDRLFIERFLIEKPRLIESMLADLSEGRFTDGKELVSLKIRWLGKGKNKNIYRLWLQTSGGEVFTLAVSAIRHNPWNVNFDRESLEKSINNWIFLSDNKHPSVPRILGHEWANDFRPRMTDVAIKSANPEVINNAGWIKNDIAIVFRTFADGDDLDWTLNDPGISESEKLAFKKEALQACLDIWNHTKSSHGWEVEGLFVGDPKPANIVVAKKGNAYQAQNIDLDVLREFKSFEEIVSVMRYYREYDDLEILELKGKAVAMGKEEAARTIEAMLDAATPGSLSDDIKLVGYLAGIADKESIQVLLRYREK
ncbi:MAG: hypothetical protein HQ595_00235, partial [Candidatus Omnitrophica bacterium]|nr:hypothetical protein [Candidatus Omnitrophota bacterium]